jgi:epoxyqueuosine reductase
MKIEDQIKARSLELGFARSGICEVKSGEIVPHLEEWLAAGYHGEMKYMENEKRLSPDRVLNGIRSMVVVAMNYRWPDGAGKQQEAMVSKYAWGSDYHRIMLPPLEQLAVYLRGLCPGSAARAYVDTGPISEKYWAQKAGIGWIGKHTNVLNRNGSSWFFLGVILSDADLQADEPAEDHCGTCERCMKACPTNAIIAPYVLDSRLCISYLTIELRGSIPVELRPLIGTRIFGCDDCQDVCPWNRFAHAGDPRFNPRPEILAATLRDYLRLSPDEFKQRFAGTNVLRPKYRGFIRNCLVAAGNAKRMELKTEIAKHIQSDDEMIREHAQWAMAQYVSD